MSRCKHTHYYWSNEYTEYWIINMCMIAGAMSTCITIGETVKPVLGDRPSSPAKVVIQDRWSLITGCTQNHVGIIMNAYMYVCIIYTGRQALD